MSTIQTKNPSIYEVAEAIKDKLPYYFSTETLSFFGQTIRSFRVKHSPRGNIFLYAPSYWDRKLMGHTFCIFTGDDLQTIKTDSENNLDKKEILNYIKNH